MRSLVLLLVCSTACVKVKDLPPGCARDSDCRDAEICTIDRRCVAVSTTARDGQAGADAVDEVTAGSSARDDDSSDEPAAGASGSPPDSSGAAGRSARKDSSDEPAAGASGSPPASAGADAGGATSPAEGRRGAACSASSECGADSCVDGRCCESACDPCTFCAVPGSEGQCVPVGGVDDPDNCQDSMSCSAGECVPFDLRQLLDDDRFGFGPADAEHLIVAQTLTFERAGMLVEVRLKIECVDAMDEIQVSLNDMMDDKQPSLTVRAWTRRDTSALQTPLSTDWISLQLDGQFPVGAGSRAALVVQAEKAKSSCTIQSTATDAYKGGLLWYKASPDAAWYALGGQDLTFQTLVAP